MLVSVILSLFSLIVTFTHSKPSAAPQKTEIVFQCEAGWPSSRSQELSPWEIQAWEDHNPTGSLTRRDSLKTIVTHWSRDAPDAPYTPGDKVAEGLSSAQTQEPPSDDVKLSTDWVFTIGAQPSSNPHIPPTMPTYFTHPNCCWLSFPCYEFFLKHSSGSPQFLSLEWKKGLCCYRAMVRNENCTDPPLPPDLQRMYIAPPPYCMT